MNSENRELRTVAKTPLDERLSNEVKTRVAPSFVIVDNARYHHSKETQAIIDTLADDILMAFLPAYSPELNPDEQVWNHAKPRLVKLSIFDKQDMKPIQKQVPLIKSSGGRTHHTQPQDAEPYEMTDTKYILQELDI